MALDLPAELAKKFARLPRHVQNYRMTRKSREDIETIECDVIRVYTAIADAEPIQSKRNPHTVTHTVGNLRVIVDQARHTIVTVLALDEDGKRLEPQGPPPAHLTQTIGSAINLNTAATPATLANTRRPEPHMPSTEYPEYLGPPPPMLIGKQCLGQFLSAMKVDEEFDVRDFISLYIDPPVFTDPGMRQSLVAASVDGWVERADSRAPGMWKVIRKPSIFEYTPSSPRIISFAIGRFLSAGRPKPDTSMLPLNPADWINPPPSPAPPPPSVETPGAAVIEEKHPEQLVTEKMYAKRAIAEVIDLVADVAPQSAVPAGGAGMVLDLEFETDPFGENVPPPIVDPIGDHIATKVADLKANAGTWARMATFGLPDVPGLEVNIKQVDGAARIYARIVE